MYRLVNYTFYCFTLFLLGCAGPAPVPEPGMKVIQHDRGEEMQVATDVDWNSYTKIILHSAPVAFKENWRSNQERIHGKKMRDEDVERIQAAVSDQLAKAMFKTLSERGGYEMTSESGPGVLVFMPNVIDLDVAETGWVQNSILESLPDTRGSMTTELVIRDAMSDRLLAVGWQDQSDPRQGDMEMTISVSNASAFRLMSQNFADWVLRQLEKARSGSD